MDMKIKRSYLLIAAAMAVLLAGLGCQTAKKPVSALPAFQASTPPIQAPAPSKTSPAPTTAKPTAPVQAVNKQAEPEPDPIDEANEVTNYPVDPSLKAQATAEIKATHSDLPLMMTDQVAGYINYFSSRGHGTLERALTRSGRYREMIERILKEEGVPQDLIYLAQAESGFHPYAVSRAGARGIWQFMGSRARAYD